MKKIDLAVGGQALIEGVMIRSPNYVTVAVRKPGGEITVKHDHYLSLTKRIKALGLPVIRGFVMLMETMVIGMKALNYSAEQALEEQASAQASEASLLSKKTDETLVSKQSDSPILGVISFTFSIILSLTLAIFLFKFVPLYTTEYLRKIWPLLQKSTVVFNLVDGLIRIAIFFLYIGILAQFKTFQRVFQYHGAEHKSIFTYEKGLPLDPEHVKRESPRHPRCGTSFLIIVLIVSILLLSLVPRHPVFWFSFLRRLSIIPLIMGVGYEVLKWTAKHQNHPIMKFLTYPGILTQYITTKEPNEAQIEVALASLKKAVELEGEKSGSA